MAKIDTKRILAAVDAKDRDYYNSLDEPGRKSLQQFYYMLQRYVSSSQNMAEHHIYFTNLFCNLGFLSDTGMTRHPELMWKSFCAVGTGRKQFHPYLKPPGSKKKRNKVHDWIADQNPTWKSDDVELFCAVNSTDDLKAYAQDHGMNDREIQELFK